MIFTRTPRGLVPKQRRGFGIVDTGQIRPGGGAPQTFVQPPEPDVNAWQIGPFAFDAISPDSKITINTLAGYLEDLDYAYSNHIPNLCALGNHSPTDPSDPPVCQVTGYAVNFTSPGQIPQEWVPYLQKILFLQLEGKDQAGFPRSFGNYWYNDSMGDAPWKDRPQAQQSYRDWMTALGVQPNQSYYLPFVQIWAPGVLPYNSARWYNGAPIATFSHPVTGENWGIWLELVLHGTAIGSTENQPKHEEFAGSCFRFYDRPNDQTSDSTFFMTAYVARMDDLKSLLPKDCGSVLDVLLHMIEGDLKWIGNLGKAIIKGLEGLTCDAISDPAGAAAMTGLLTSKGMKNAGSIVSSFQKQCQGQQSGPDCKDPRNAFLNACKPQPPVVVVSTTPPWGLIAMGAGAFILVLALASSSKRKAAA